jgi:acyl-[acyl-carrier-protein]-phospholipid O-acyltransferase/long-chain-fatty-acid--[acyl-carrier-protein] ligase
VWLLSRTIYRVRITGLENLPATGGALLVPNHVSWLDGVLLVLVSSRPIRMIVWAGNFQNRFLRWLAMDSGMILLGTRPKEIAAALRTARAALAQGELVCIFPEGGITRSGQLLSFRPGLLKILEGTSAPVLPVYLDGLWGSIFSFERGRFFWKWPRRWPYPLQIDFGQPFANPGDVHRVRRAVQELGAAAVTRRLQSGNPLLPALLQTCARQRWTAKIADSTGAKLTGGQVLLHTLVLRRLLRRGVWSADETHVGVLLPPSTASVTANLALAVDRRVSVNLNYTATAAILDKCLAQANVRHVLTSRRFLDKLPLQLSTEFVFIEDLVSRITALDRLVSACQAYAVPWRMLLWLLGLTKVRGHDVLTVIFTSGSTGEPKGVALTHANVASNVDAAQQIVRIKSDDVLIGVLPFFHSFGYTITLWTVGTIRAQGVYHFNPLDARTVAKLCREYRGTVLIATPTFLRMYLRRCAPEDLQTLDIVMTGAERLPRDLADAFAEKFGLRPVEGYGATELAPLAAANSPPKRVPPSFQIHEKDGTVGRPIPGVAAKVVDVTSGEELSANQEGMLWITGANVMKGYLGRDDLTAQAIRDGWYVTGDMARIDDDGFVEITGRVSRFSKIGGEMVPHIRVEEALNQLVGPNEDGSARIAVTAVSDSKKGERLIVVHTPLPRSPEDLCQALAQEGLPNLYIPSPDSFSPVDRLPVLGTGKLDLQALSELARQRFAGG